MSDLRTAAQQALAWLGPDPPTCCGCREEWQQAIDVLRAALAEDAMQRLTNVQQEIMESEIKVDKAEPVQEPVAWRTKNATPPGGYVVFQQYPSAVANLGGEIEPLYTAPPQRKPLTDELIADLWHQNGGFYHHFARAIERVLKNES